MKPIPTPPLDKYLLRVLPTSLLPAQQVDLAPQKDHLLITATGSDPQLLVPKLRSNQGGRFAFRLDIMPPAPTLLELFYKTDPNAPFSGAHVASTPLKAGRSTVQLEFTDPAFVGMLRLDPGTCAGDYRLYSMEVFSSAPLGAGPVQRPQAELAATFESSKVTLFNSASVDQSTQLRPLRARLSQTKEGIRINAVDKDPALLLPQVHEAFIAKVVLVTPGGTTMQLFYLPSDGTDFDEEHSLVQPLIPGRNVVYFELDQPDFTGTLRLDPGDMPGEYVLAGLEIRRAVAP